MVYFFIYKNYKEIIIILQMSKYMLDNYGLKIELRARDHNPPQFDFYEGNTYGQERIKDRRFSWC